MGFTFKHKLDSQVSAGAGATKRRRVDDDSALAGPSRAVAPAGPILAVAPAQPDRADVLANPGLAISPVQSDRAASPPLPAGFPVPPAGLEATFATWARCWRQLHGNEALSLGVQLEIGRFVRTITNIPRPVDDEPNEVPPNIAALKVSRDQVADHLSAVTNSVDISEYQQAIERLRIISDAYESARISYESARISYESARATRRTQYSSQLEAAAEQVDWLLSGEAEPAAAAATTDMVDAPTQRTLLEGLPAIYVGSNTEPSIHPSTVRNLSVPEAVYDSNIVLQVLEFQARALRDHNGLGREQILLRQGDAGVTTGHPRHLAAEENMGSFLVPEVLRPVEAIINYVHPGVHVSWLAGSATQHADFFIVVTVKVDGVSRRSAFCVECKCPYGQNKLPPLRSLSADALPGEEEYDQQMRMAGLPTRNYGRQALGEQLRAYVRVRNIANQAPVDVRLCLNRRHGILTDFNQTWIATFDPVPAIAAADNADNADDDPTEHLRITVSQNFHATNAIPHMAFVYAFVVDRVIGDIRASPEDYAQVTSLTHQGPGLGQTVTSPRSRRSRGRGQTGSVPRGAAPVTPVRYSLRLAEQRRQAVLPSGNSAAMDTTTDKFSGRSSTAALIALINKCNEAASVVLNPGCTLLGLATAGADIAAALLLPDNQSSFDCEWQPLRGSLGVGHVLGNGRSGEVFEGWFNGEHVALKCCPATAPLEILHELSNEVLVYEHLSDIQGSVMPRLFDHGLLAVEGELFLVLVLELIKDEINPTDRDRANDLIEQLTLDEKRAALDALRTMHGYGVCQGDPHDNNILFERTADDGSPLVPRIIDFAFAITRASDTDIADDMAGWTEVLGINADECTAQCLG
ncbi:hypothetical protein GGH96_005833 [Coemansia sp. RSA 1972]|nr:hypothetical protein GGH96_005833 [Coemansia sp. RSA 1972]